MLHKSTFKSRLTAMQASHIGGISCMESEEQVIRWGDGDGIPLVRTKMVLSSSSSHWRFDLWLLICAPKKKKKKQNEIEACGAITQRHTIWPTCLPLDCIPLLCLASLGHMSSATHLQTSFLRVQNCSATNGHTRKPDYRYCRRHTIS